MAESVSYWICSCGKSNLNAQRRCSACNKRRPLSWPIYGIVAVCLVLLIAIFTPKSDDVGINVTDLPSSQTAFLGAITQARFDIAASPNSLAASRALTMRDVDLSQWRTVSQWRGRVLGVQQMQGKGAFSIDVGGAELVAGVHLMLGFDTLVPPNDHPLFGQVSGLRVGDIVDVSGEFVTHEGALVELSYTGSGSVKSPRFLFEFSEVSRVNE